MTQNFQLLNETIQAVMWSLRAHKLRSLLTLVGIIIGTAVVAMVGAVLTGLSKRVAAVSEKSAPNVIYFTREERIGPSFATPTPEERQRKDLTYDDALAVAALPSPQGVSPQRIRGSYGPTANAPTIIAGTNTAINPLALGVWDNFPDIVSVNVEYGRFFTESERRTRVSVAIIGNGIARQLFEERDPIDKEIRLDGHVFRVIGVLKAASGEGVIGSDDLDERVVYVPFETLAKFYPDNKATIIVVRAPAGRLDEVTDEVSFTLRQRRGVAADAPNNFGVNRAEQVFTIVNQAISGLALVSVPVALASLLVGGVGVMNIMLVAVTERTKEIGIRRAVGARRKDILIQFLLEAMTLTGVGGIIGIACGFLFAFAVSQIISFPAAVPLWAIAAGVGAASSVGLLAGVWPARRAARLDPVTAIRAE